MRTEKGNPNGYGGIPFSFVLLPADRYPQAQSRDSTGDKKDAKEIPA